MNLRSMKFRFFAIIVFTVLVFTVLLTIYAPYQAKKLGEIVLVKDAEFITQLLVDNLALGMQTLIFDEGAALEQTLSLLDKGDTWETTIKTVRVFDEKLNFVKGFNIRGKKETEFEASNETVYQEVGDILQIWTPMKDAYNNKIGYVQVDFSKHYLSEQSGRDSRNALIIALIALSITLIPAVRIVSKTVSNVNKLVTTLRSVASGNVNVEVNIDSRDEIGDLASSTSILVNTSKALTHAANAIGEGNYDVDLQIRSEDDLLSKSIIRMKDNLQKMAKDNETQNWFKTGQAELSDRMRGDQSVIELAGNVLSYLAAYMKSQIGTIYLLEKDTLKLVSSYAYKKRKNLSDKFKIGEGIIGQVALEKKSILLSNIPDDYIKVTSGIGEGKPLNVLVTPLIYDQQIFGVVELGSFTEYTELHLNFIETASENIAIALNSAMARTRVRELLEETKEQASELQSQQEELKVTNEELQAQQEELRVANEELEEQAKVLKESEQKLQQQQEELKVSNEELETQTEELRERQAEIEHKNADLEKARVEIERKARELELSSRYKSEFLANMSHELRTPLNSIQILSKLLAENKEGGLTDKQINFAKTISSSGSDLLNLINEILDLSKIEAGRMVLNLEEMSLSLLPAYLQQNFEHMVEEKGLYLKIETDDHLPETIVSDRQRVEQIIKNLMSNATKFTDKGGITVSIRRPAESADLFRSGLDRTRSIAIAVSDTGIGIPAEKKQQIFQAFQQADGTTSRKYGGTGLGLSISLELAKLLGGEIQVESEQDKGSTFTIYLPEKSEGKLVEKREQELNGERESEAVAEAQVAAVSAAQKPMQRVNEIRDDRLDLHDGEKFILVVEDDAAFAKVLFDFTREKGYKCIIAEDGEAGLQLANQYKPSAIILDVGLPRMDGWTVMERLKANSETRHIPVYFITAQEKRMTAMQMGAIGYLTKPVSPEGLNKAFGKIEKTLSKSIKKLLIVEDDKTMRESIIQLIGNGDVKITALSRGEQAYELMKKEDFDCMVLDLGLSDISGFDLIDKIKADDRIGDIPIIIYTGKQLSKKEETKLQKHADSIIVKGARSPERLLDEVSLFLHRLEANLPQQKQKQFKMLHDSDEIYKGKRILLVDDDVRNIFALSSVLEEKEMEVLIAENGKEAVEKLKAEGNIDLVLMDIMMPEMDGYQAMGKIRRQKKFAKLPMIALTAKAMKGDRQKCIEAGANDYLSKPVDVEKLLSLLQVWLYKS